MLVRTERKHLGLLEEGWSSCDSLEWVRIPQKIYGLALQTQDQDACPTMCLGAGSLSMGIGRAILEHGLLAVGYREMNWGKGREEIHSKERLWKKIGLLWKQGASVESHTRGGVTSVAVLFPYASTSNWATEKDQLGVPLLCLLPGTRKGPSRAAPCTPPTGS